MSGKIKRFSMFSNGTVIGHQEDGGIVPATEIQVAQHLAGFLPQQYKGERLSEVMFNPEDGFVYGKYASKKIKKKIKKLEQTESEANPDCTGTRVRPGRNNLDSLCG